MATREPRRTAYKLQWHREPAQREADPPGWWCSMGGVRVAAAVNTSATGTDNYPWDWYLTEAGIGNQRHPGRTYGVADTLRSVKQIVDDLLKP